MMSDNHGESTAKVKAAADAASITVPAPTLDPEQQRMLDEIKAADAATIDAVYIRNQQAAHDAALALHRAYAPGADTPGLQAVAGAIVPVIATPHAEPRNGAQTEPADSGCRNPSRPHRRRPARRTGHTPPL